MSAAESLSEPNEIKAIYLAAEDLKIAASILYQAYHDDPLFVDIFDVQKDDYEKRLRSAIREELNAFWQAKQPMIGLFDGDRLMAVACITNPGNGLSVERFWHWRLKMLLTAGYVGTKHMMEKEQRIRDSMPESEFHMLSFIGVHPDHQHHGLGHVLMRAIDSLLLENESSKGVGVFVTLQKNLAFFKDGGYDLVKRIEVGHIQGDVVFRHRDSMVSI